MASKACVERMTTIIESMGSGRRELLEPHFAEDLRWWTPRSASAQAGLASGALEGLDAFMELSRGASQVYASMQMHVLRVVEDGDLVAVHTRGQGSTRAGKSYDNTYVFLFRFADGKVAEVWEFLDTAYAYSRFV